MKKIAWALGVYFGMSSLAWAVTGPIIWGPNQTALNLAKNGFSSSAGGSSNATATAFYRGTAAPGTISVTATGTTVTGVGNTNFFTTFMIGDSIVANGETHVVSAIASDTSMTTDAWTGTFAGAYTTVAGVVGRVWPSGKLQMGGSTSSIAKLVTSNSRAVLVNDGNSNTLSMSSYRTAGGVNSLIGYSGRGTEASTNACQNGDTLMQVLGRGWTTATFAGGAGMAIKAAETWSTTAQGTYISFTATPLLSTTTTERMRIDGYGHTGHMVTPDVDVGLYVAETLTDPGTATSKSNVNSTLTTNQTSAARTKTSLGGTFSSVVGTSNTQNWTGSVANNIMGLKGATGTTGSATGTISNATTLYGSWDNGAASTIITNQYGLVLESGTLTGTVTSQNGISISGITGATNNTHLLLGTKTIPSGNWSVYSTSSSDSSFNGQVKIGANTTPATTLDVNGSIKFSTGVNAAALLLSATAPTVSSGFGTSPSIASNNGTAAFTVNVGTGGVATSGVIGLPTATTGWNCFCNDITTSSATVLLCKQTASSTTSATIGNFATTGAAAAWAASDIVRVSCFAY